MTVHEHQSISVHKSLDCLLKSLFRLPKSNHHHSILLVPFAGNPKANNEFPAQITTGFPAQILPAQRANNAESKSASWHCIKAVLQVRRITE